MAELNDETNLPEGQVASPKQPPSPGKGVQSSVDADELAERAAAILERKAQSKRDKRINDFDSRLERMEKLIADSLPKQAALYLMGMEDRLSEQSEAKEPPQTRQDKSVGTGDSATSKLTQQLSSALGLDANDPEMTSILKEAEFATQAELMLALSDKRKKAQETPTNPGQQMPVGGGSAIHSEDKEAIGAEMIRLMNTNPRDPRIQQLNAKLKTIK